MSEHRHLTIQASYGGCPDVTTWDLLYGDIYQCRCCKTRMALTDLTVVER